MTKPFHIAFGVDNNYARPMGVTIASILENNPDMKFAFHVFTQGLSPENVLRLKQLAEKRDTEINIHLIDDAAFQQFSDFPKFRHYSAAIFNRLLIPLTLQTVTNRVLYLDADILCVGSIRELIDMDMADYAAAVVHDSPKTARRQSKILGLKEEKYFNSGFLYMNLEKWAEHKISETIMSVLTGQSKALSFPDQDALNAALEGKVVYLESKWNYQYRLTTILKSGQVTFDVAEDTVFIHFIGAMKPWRDWSPHASKQVFDRYQSITTWGNAPFNERMHYKEMHSLAAFLMKNGEYREAGKWYWRYIKKKLM